jgi:two-component system, LytTR family, sensor kinase
LRSVKKHMYWIVGVTFATILAIHCSVLYYECAFNWKLALYEASIGTAFLAASAWGVILAIRSYPTTAVIYLYAIGISVGISILAVGVQTQLLSRTDDLITPEYRLWLKHSFVFRLIIHALFNIWIATTAALRKIISSLEERFQQHADASALLKDAELFKLRHQLQPHFLYNSLNSINALILLAPAKAQEMVGKLSDFLRLSVSQDSAESTPLADEIRYLQNYLAIEAIRFGDRLQVHIVQNVGAECKIPPFLLQPILENAIKFGLYGRTGNVDIQVSLHIEDKTLYLVVTNPYDKDMQPPRGTGFGLEGIRRRLYLQYARTDLLETEYDDEKFTTTLKIPQ